MTELLITVGSSGRVVDGRIVNRWDGGSIPPTAVSLCLSEEKLKAGGSFYLVSMPAEVKYPTRGLKV